MFLILKAYLCTLTFALAGNPISSSKNDAINETIQKQSDHFVDKVINRQLEERLSNKGVEQQESKKHSRVKLKIDPSVDKGTLEIAQKGIEVALESHIPSELERFEPIYYITSNVEPLERDTTSEKNISQSSLQSDVSFTQIKTHRKGNSEEYVVNISPDAIDTIENEEGVVIPSGKLIITLYRELLRVQLRKLPIKSLSRNEEEFAVREALVVAVKHLTEKYTKKIKSLKKSIEKQNYISLVADINKYLGSPQQPAPSELPYSEWTEYQKYAHWRKQVSKKRREEIRKSKNHG